MSIMVDLPVELASLIVDSCDYDTLLSVCLISREWQVLAQRSLFRKVDLRTVTHCMTCCSTLFKRPDLCESVRDFLVMFDTNDHLFPSFWNILARTLNLMQNLVALHFAMSGPSKILLRDCTFPQLRVLSSVLDLSVELHEFLARHPTIKQLCIGGEASKEHLILPPSALPALETYLGSRALAQDLIPGRPVTKMTLAWTSRISDAEIAEIIQTLARSSVLVRHFGCTTVGSEANRGILSALAEHMAELRTLCVNNVASGRPLNETFVSAVRVALEEFKELYRLDIPCVINANDDSYDSTQEVMEEEVVRQWSKACPSLRIITLPSCMTWCLERGRFWRRELNERAVTGFETF